MKSVLCFLLLLLSVPACKRSSGGDDVVFSAWTHPSSLSDNISPDHADAFTPVVAMNNNGHILITWVQSDGTHDQIFKSEYRGGVWTHPSGQLDNVSPDGSSAYSPAVAVSDCNDMVITWQQWNGTYWQIYKSEYRGGAWAHPLGLTDGISPDDSNADDQKVAMDDQGTTAVVWKQWDGANWQAFLSECRGGHWTHPSGQADHISPSGQDIDDMGLAMNSTGNAVIVWNQSDGSVKQVFMSECQGGIWSHPSDLTDNISPEGYATDDPTVVMNDHGDAVVVWEQEVSAWRIFKSEFRSNAWTHPYNADDHISPAGPNAWGIALDMDDHGNTVVAWEQWDGSYWQVFMSEYRNGVWSHPLDLTDCISPNGSNVTNIGLCMDPSGNTVIAWEQLDGSFNQIFMSEYRYSVWTHPLDLGDHISPDGQNAFFSNLVKMDRNGNTLIVWEQSDGSFWQVFKSEYRAGVWYFPSDVLDNISPDDQDAAHLDMVMNDNGYAAIVWLQSDGSHQQVFKSIYR